MRIFCDTNTLLSAALFPNGRVATIFALLIERHHEVMTSDFVLDEFRTVVARKFPAKITDAELFVSIFHSSGLTVTTPQHADADETQIRDPKDRPILRGARAAGADVLLTGDRDLLDAGIDAPEILDAATPSKRLDQSR